MYRAMVREHFWNLISRSARQTNIKPHITNLYEDWSNTLVLKKVGNTI